MTYLILGFITGLSLILAIGPQNIFVIEQGIKKQYIFIVCLICSVSDMILIFLGIFLFIYLESIFNPTLELFFNFLLIIFLIYFIYSKLIEKVEKINLDSTKYTVSLKIILSKTLGFTYLNPHVYSDTVFFLGNFSKSFSISEKIFFGVGASISSFIFFYSLGYASNYFSKYINSLRAWMAIKWIIILIMSSITFYVAVDIYKYFN